MDDLIIFSGGTEQFPVDCRVLHEQLKPKTPYRIWFPRQIEGVFVEGEDFTPNKNVRVQIEGKPHTCWTQKGRVFLYDLLKTDGILPLIERDQAMA